MLRSFKSIIVGSSLFALCFLPTMVSAGGIGAGLDLGPVGAGGGVDTGPGGAGAGANVNVGDTNIGVGAGGGWRSGSDGYYAQDNWRSGPHTGYYAQDNWRSGQNTGYYTQDNWRSGPNTGYYAQDNWRSGPNTGYYAQDNWKGSPSGSYVQGGWQGGYSGGPTYRTDYPGQVYQQDNYPYSQYYYYDRNGDGIRDDAQQGPGVYFNVR